MSTIDKVIDEHSRYLVRIAYLYVKNWSTAEDIVQEVFVTYFQKSDQFRNEASLKTYLTKITANRAKDYLRSWKHKKDVLFDTIFTSEKGAEEVVLEQERLATLEKNLFQLPLKYREPLILFYYDEQSIAEIADYLQLNENTVKTRLRRAKQQLKEFFEEEDGEVREQLSDFKRNLDRMMGDTSKQERRIKQRVHERLQTPTRKFSWQVLFVTAAIPVVALFLLLTIDTTNLLSSDTGPGVPYDPLDDLAQISALQKKKQLSAVDYEEFAALSHFSQVDGLYYVDKEQFSLQGSSDAFHTVIERKANLFDEVVYEPGDIVRTMTNTTSHLPTYEDVYYEVIAVPGDRVVLQNGQLKINGKSLKSDIMDRYEKEGITIAGGYEQVLNAREYFLLNHFPASETVQGATITPVHKIYGQVVGIATEERTDSMYMDYLAGQLTGDYTPEQYFDLYLYDDLLGFGNLPETPAFTQISRLGELFLEASYRKTAPVSENEVEIRYQYGREGVAEQVFSMKRDAGTGRWMIEE